MQFSFSTSSDIMDQFSSGFDFALCNICTRLWSLLPQSVFLQISKFFYVYLMLQEEERQPCCQPAAPGGISICTAPAIYLSTGRCQCQATFFSLPFFLPWMNESRELRSGQRTFKCVVLVGIRKNLSAKQNIKLCCQCRICINCMCSIVDGETQELQQAVSVVLG